jgi:hypothetical protein
MKYLVTTLLILLLTIPAPLYATPDPPSTEFVEKPVTTMCGEPPAKCFDQVNFKLYLLMRTQYIWLHKQHTAIWPAIEAELKKSAKASQEAAGLHKQDAARWHGAYDELFPKYTTAVQRAHKAEAHSIWGGGLPWLITAVVAGLAAGTVLGIYIESKVTQ